MGLLNIFKRQEKLPQIDDKNIVAICNGEMIEPSKIEDKMFAQELMGKTVGFIPKSKEILSPCNGILEVLFPTGHAFAVRRRDGTGVLVHIGINTVDLNGKGFKSFVKQGSFVKAGEKIVEVDFDEITNAGLSSTTMVIISEPVEGINYDFKSYGYKEKIEIIL